MKVDCQVNIKIYCMNVKMNNAKIEKPLDLCDFFFKFNFYNKIVDCREKSIGGIYVQKPKAVDEGTCWTFGG